MWCSMNRKHVVFGLVIMTLGGSVAEAHSPAPLGPVRGRAGGTVIVALPTQAAVAAKRATGTIPIVMTSVVDPEVLGLVASFARPAGKVTGLSYTAGALMVDKQLQLLQEPFPASHALLSC